MEFESPSEDCRLFGVSAGLLPNTTNAYKFESPSEDCRLFGSRYGSRLTTCATRRRLNPPPRIGSRRTKMLRGIGKRQLVDRFQSSSEDWVPPDSPAPMTRQSSR